MIERSECNATTLHTAMQRNARVGLGLGLGPYCKPGILVLIIAQCLWDSFVFSNLLTYFLLCVFVSLCLCVGVPYLRESDELWWKEGRSKAGEPSQDELNQFIGFSQVFKMIVESVSSTKIVFFVTCVYHDPASGCTYTCTYV